MTKQTSKSYQPNGDFSKVSIVLYSILISLCDVIYGYTISYTSITKSALVDSGMMNERNGKYYSSIMIAGCLIGSVLSGFVVMNKCGRKVTLLVGSALYAIGYILPTFILIPNVLFREKTTLALLLIGRIFVGMGTGFNSVCVAAFQSEILIDDIRTYLTPLPCIFIGVGIGLGYCLTYMNLLFDLKGLESYLKVNSDQTKGYIFQSVILWSHLIGLILSIYQLAVGFIMPESPVWKQYKIFDKEQLDLKMRKFARRIYNNSHFGIQFYNEDTIDEKMSILESFKLLAKKEYIKRTIITFVLQVFSNLLGVYAFMFNLNDILQTGTPKSTNDPDTTCPICESYRKSGMNVVIVAIAIFSATLLSVPVLRFGNRKVVGTGGGLLQAVPLITLGYYFYNPTNNAHLTWLPITCLVAYFIFYITSWNFIPWVIPVEISTNKTIDMILGIASITNWITSFLVAISYEALCKNLGMGGVYWFYASCCITGAVVVAIFPPETKNRDPETVDRFYKSNKIFNFTFS